MQIFGIVRYFLGLLLKCYRTFEECVTDVIGAKMSKPDRIRNAIDRTVGRFTKAQLLETCPDITKQRWNAHSSSSWTSVSSARSVPAAARHTARRKKNAVGNTFTLSTRVSAYSSIHIWKKFTAPPEGRVQ